MSPLFLIPARGGSKGIPGKNFKYLGDKPLIHYSLEVARTLSKDENICVSTDDSNIVKAVETVGYETPFIRPEELASDTASSYEVMLHAIRHYESIGRNYETLVLLQPTSPFRKAWQVKEAIEIFTSDIDMVVSVKLTKASPYYLLMEEDQEGWLQKSKTSTFTRRQDVPPVYELNGAIYVINIERLKQQPLHEFTRVKKYVMDEITSVDIDDPLDWVVSEALIEKGLVTNK